MSTADKIFEKAISSWDYGVYTEEIKECFRSRFYELSEVDKMIYLEEEEPEALRAYSAT